MIAITSKFLITFLQISLFLVLSTIPSSFEDVSNGVRCRETERLALLNFKSQLIDGDGLVSDWGTYRGEGDDHEKECCKWAGVLCDNRTNHVIGLYLSGSEFGPAVIGRGNISMSLLELPHLNYLDLNGNFFNGIQIPKFICSLGKLQHLNLGYSNFSGQIPNCLRNLSQLQFLDLSMNSLYDTNLYWLSSFKSLKYLDLSINNFQGANIPGSLGNLTSLQFLVLSGSNFSGHVPKSIRYLSKIETIILSSNRLEGLISEAHMFNLSKLRILDLSFNSNLTVRANSSWNPPFQLENVYLASCKLGPYFPKWLQNQKQLQTLDISNANIFDSVPNWFWDNIQMSSTLNMSYNHIYGVIPDLSFITNLSTIDLSSNEFNGSLPLLPSNVRAIYFSGNKLSGTICNISDTFRFLRYLDLSDNLFSTQIPQHCFMNLMDIGYLNLANNDFSGEILNSIDLPSGVYSLHLRNNSFTGEISMSLKNCNNLYILDLGENNFTGEIPDWLGPSMPNLIVLSLKSNNIHGGLPRSLCHLQNLQVLDISFNNISGTIPECLKNFTQLSSQIDPNSIGSWFFAMDFYHSYDDAYVVWKGKEAKYTSTLRFLTLIDLSSNNLTGEIPREITSLAGLLALNLSRNNLVGLIPSDIGRLELLNFLDLSKNKLLGSIPPTLGQLNHLGVLDLSFNNLSGKIPWDAHLQTFNASIYMENPGLCGPPLVLKPCLNDKTPIGNIDETNNSEHDNLFNSRGFYVSMAVGFIVAFWGVSGTLFFNKWCRITIAKMFIYAGDWLYVKIMINKNRLQRYFGNC